MHMSATPLPSFFFQTHRTLKESVDIWEVAALENLFILLVSIYGTYLGTLREGEISFFTSLKLLGLD